MNRISYYLIFILTFLFSCKATEVNKDNTRMNNEELSSCAVDACTITGTIKSIIEEKNNSNTESPCSKVPCWAIVKVDNVLNIGSRFASSISQNDEIKMFFIFTLSETSEELFPNLDKRFPGLKKEDRFKANVTCRFQPGEDGCKWVVYDYIVI